MAQMEKKKKKIISGRKVQIDKSDDSNEPWNTLHTLADSIINTLVENI